MGLTMETGTVQRWLAVEGHQVVAGDVLLEIETDKVVVEIEAPAAGTLSDVLVREGETVPIGAVLARILAPGEQGSDGAVDSGRRAAKVTTEPVVRPDDSATATVRQATEQMRRAPESAPHGGPDGDITPTIPQQQVGRGQRVFSSPRARKRAREASLDWRTIPGTGPLGRVIERDVMHGFSDPHNPPPASVMTLDQSPSERDEAASTGSAQHFHLSAEARADELLELRDRLAPTIEGRTGIRLTVTDLLIKIAAAAITDHPHANAVWDPKEGGRVSLLRQVDIGIAVAAGDGLVVPVVLNAAGMGLAEIALERSRLVQKVREGGLPPGDLKTQAFTLADLGAYRVDVFQGLLSPPQTAILAAGRITERPVAVRGSICVRPTLVVTLSCDCRVIGSLLAVQLLDRVIELIEEPYGLIA
jgi:pyruvate dehydrogenase E2 component (dihydrolipoamide acetyltransferase)